MLRHCSIACVVRHLADPVTNEIVRELTHGRLLAIDVDRELTVRRQAARLGCARHPPGSDGVVQDLLAVDEVEAAEVREIAEEVALDDA